MEGGTYSFGTPDAKRRRVGGRGLTAAAAVRAIDQSTPEFYRTFSTKIDSVEIDAVVSATANNAVTGFGMRTLFARAFQGGVRVRVSGTGASRLLHTSGDDDDGDGDEGGGSGGRESSSNGLDMIANDEQHMRFFRELFDLCFNSGLVVVEGVEPEQLCGVTRGSAARRGRSSRLVPNVPMRKHWELLMVQAPGCARRYEVYMPRPVATVLGQEYLEANTTPQGVRYAGAHVYELDPPDEDGHLRSRMTALLGKIRTIETSWRVLETAMEERVRISLTLEHPPDRTGARSGGDPLAQPQSRWAEGDLHVSRSLGANEEQSVMNGLVARQLQAAQGTARALNRTGAPIGALAALRVGGRIDGLDRVGKHRLNGSGVSDVLSLPRGLQVARSTPQSETVDDFAEHIKTATRLLLGGLNVPPQLMQLDSYANESNAKLMVDNFNRAVHTLQDELCPLLEAVFRDLRADELDEYVARRVHAHMKSNLTGETDVREVHAARRALRVHVEWRSTPVHTVAELLELRNNAVLSADDAGRRILEAMRIPEEELVHSGDAVLRKQIDSGLDLLGAAAKVPPPDAAKPKSKPKPKAKAKAKRK